MTNLSSIPPLARKSLIGSPSNFWLHHTAHGFDLTHPPSPTTPTTTPTLTLETTTTPITIEPSKSALLIIDMQNFFLSEAIGRARGAGHAAADKLAQYAIPAARKAGVRVVWLNWGLTEEDLRCMPPAVKRCFGFHSIPVDDSFERDFTTPGPNSVSVDRFGVEKKVGTREAMYHGLGAPCGSVKLGDGQEVDAGRLLMRDTWNGALYPPLAELFTASISLPKPDIIVYKNRLSGLWDSSTPLQAFLEKEGITTLLFAGVNTDQCVGGTLTDAFSRGYDCVLLSDGCGTSSGEGAQKTWEYNAARTYGFCTRCNEVARGVERTKTSE